MPSRFDHPLLLALEFTADWREEKAKEYPEDRRNVQAANQLKSLAKSVGEIADEQLWERLDQVYAEGDIKVSEAQSQFFREIGFYSEYSNGHEFLEALVSELEAQVA